MKFNLFFVLGLFYIGCFVGVAFDSVGESSGEPIIFGWSIVWAVFCFVSIPFILGYLSREIK